MSFGLQSPPGHFGIEISRFPKCPCTFLSSMLDQTFSFATPIMQSSNMDENNVNLVQMMSAADTGILDEWPDWSLHQNHIPTKNLQVGAAKSGILKLWPHKTKGHTTNKYGVSGIPSLPRLHIIGLIVILTLIAVNYNDFIFRDSLDMKDGLPGFLLMALFSSLCGCISFFL